jgi:hypothetical protein
MYTKEEILNKTMFDMTMMVIPSKYTVKYKKLYPYTNTIPGYVPMYDSFDPYILRDSYEVIKNTSEYKRLELGLGTITVSGTHQIIDADPATNSYKIQLDGSLCDMNGDAAFPIPDSGDPLNPDGLWMIIEFTPKTDNPNIIISSNVGNNQIDIAGGTSRKFGEAHYDVADGNHQVILPMRVFSPDMGWIPVDHFGLTIKGGDVGDIVEINNIRMYEVVYDPAP